jgi:formylglycine-generating enzyme required for sulfatase activity
VGNAAEWVHGWDQGEVRCAGWSCDDAWVYRLFDGEGGEPSRLVTPFSGDGFRVVGRDEEMRHVGLRPVIRRAPQLPVFAHVTAGPVRHGKGPEDLLPPERQLIEEDDESEDGELERIRRRREPLVAFASATDSVKRDFHMASAETSNRQYLAFLSAIALQCTRDELLQYVPPTWWRVNQLKLREEPAPVPRAFYGYYPPAEKLPFLYLAGQDNAPVQQVTIAQAEDYARWLSSRLNRRCAIPTVAQYLRAARGDSLRPYPWGDDPNDVELGSSSRPDYEPERPFSLFDLPFAPPRPIVGLAGNLAEFVRDEAAGGRLLLAGGFFELPARLCTLDCFLDADWESIQFVLQPEDERPEAGAKPRLSATVRFQYYTGFRVVRLAGTF